MIKFLKNIFNSQKYTGGNPQTPQYWLQKLFGSADGDIQVNEDTALKYSAVWAAVNIISGAVGFLPLVPFKRESDGSRSKAVNHKSYDLLKTRPNPYITAQSFKQTLTAHALLWGNGYAEIERDGSGRAINYWPLLPDSTKLVYNEQVKRFSFKVTQESGPPVYLPFNDVIHIHGLGFDGMTGYSVIEYCSDNLTTGVAAERNAGTFFKNDSSPSGLLTTDQPLDGPTKEKVEKGWEEKHGLSNRYRIAVLHSGLKYQSVGVPAKDAQLLESRKYGVLDVARWFQIPPHMLAEMDNATFSNIEEQNINFVIMTLQCWLERWKQEVDYKCFLERERGRYFVDFIVDMLLRGNSEARSRIYQTALGGPNNPAYMTVDEVRRLENLPPVDGGDKLFRPSHGETDGSSDPSALFEGIWDRIVTKEVKALQKAAKKPDLFGEFVDSFYDKHEEYIKSCIYPAIEACFGENYGVLDTKSYINTRKSDVKQAFGDGKLDILLMDYNVYEAENKTNDLLEGLKNECQ